jgi:hypothetical protein
MLSIKVIPATINFLEATNLVQAMALAINLEAGQKLYSTRHII